MAQLDDLQRDVVAARADYAAANDRFLTVAGAFYADAQDGADKLLALGEEFGSSQAITAMLGNPEQLGELARTATDSYVADMADTLEETLEAVLVARDRLDQVTAERERALRQANPARQQVININGREFVIDAGRRELRSVDNPAERYLLAEAYVPSRSDNAAAAPSLTEQLAKTQQVPAAEPTKDRIRPRSR